VKKVIIWGTGKDYDQFIPYIELEKYKGNLEIIGVTSNDGWLSSIGGYSFIPKNRISDTLYDYIIVASTTFFDEIRQECRLYGINMERVLHGAVFKIPYFDFERYLQVKESKITIVSNNCWGGYLYNLLKLPFTSPFINTAVSEEHYVRLIKNLPEYLQLPLEDTKSNEHECAPCGRLGDVEILFIHHASFELAKSDWDRRAARVNWDNIFLQMTVVGEERLVNDFVKAPYKKKAAFFHHPYEAENVIYIRDWDLCQTRVKYFYKFVPFILDVVKNRYFGSYPLDILKMLLGESDFIMKK